jgi:hypothetical protein
MRSSASHLLFGTFLLGLIFDTEDRDGYFPRNADKLEVSYWHTE